MINFDEYIYNYEELHAKNIKLSGFKPAYFDEYKIKTLANDFKNNSSDKKIKFLNFGCGIGKSEIYINKYFKDVEVTSVDISKESILKAKSRNVEFLNIHFKHFTDLKELFFESKFDIIFLSNVLHHIPIDLHLETLSFLKSQLSYEGYLYVFEHNPKNFFTKKAFHSCEFDIGCEMISDKTILKMLKTTGYNYIKRKFILFFPKSLDFLIPLEKHLYFFSYGAQYWVKGK